MKGYGEKDKLSKFLSELRLRAASKPTVKVKASIWKQLEVHLWLTNSILAITMKCYFFYMKRNESLVMGLPIKQGKSILYSSKAEH